MTIVILCGYLNSQYARDILRALNSRGLQGVHVVAANGASGQRSARKLWRTHGFALSLVAARWVARRLLTALHAPLNATQHHAPTLESETTAQGGRFLVVQDVNSEETRRALSDLNVDLMILGGAPIVKAPILQVPRIGTLNAHQGALPQLRGMNVIEWALLEGIPPPLRCISSIPASILEIPLRRSVSRFTPAIRSSPSELLRAGCRASCSRERLAKPIRASCRDDHSAEKTVSNITPCILG